MNIDPEKISALIAEIAEEEIAARFGKLSGAEIDTKTGPNDFVTEADRAAEDRLAKVLGDIYPGAVFIGEERVAGDPSLLSRLDDSGAFWIVDPLDGTRNFVQGKNEYGTIVALVENGETRMGWIYAIPERKCAIGVKGGGASWDGAALAPIAGKKDGLSGYRGVGSLTPEWKDRLVPNLRAKLHTEPSRCSAYTYIALARGTADFALYSRIHPWDHAAGILILNEIGGHAEYLDDGAPYTPMPALGRPLLVAGAKDNWLRVSAMLIP